MQTNFMKAGFLAALLVLIFVTVYEFYWRNQGMPISFNDDEALWAQTRKNVYLPADESTVFIGSSRIKFDLDIPTWEKLTNVKAVQLAIVGTNPLLTLEDLAADEKFKGRLVVDVTEGLFFNLAPPNSASAEKAISYFKKETPSQSFSCRVNYLLENNFVFLEENKFSLNSLLHDLELENRPGVFSEPPFPKGFEVTNYDRQTYMTDDFVNDEKEVKRQTDIWMFFASLSKGQPPMSGDALQQYFLRIKNAVDAIKSRGGEVLFVRTPASGPMEEATKKVFPREVYWDQLLKVTNSPGIHYMDYPETSGFICPEWSHLKRSDAIVYTRHLVKTLQSEYGWSFRK